MFSQLSLDIEEDIAPERLYVLIVDVIKKYLVPVGGFDAVAVAWSGGKDSTVLLSLALAAGRRAIADGCSIVPIVVMNSDTRIENPLVSRLVLQEQHKILDYAHAHGLTVHLLTGRPPLAASWAVKVIAANGLPPMPGGKSACSIDWKIAPMGKALNAWRKQHGIIGNILKLTGTRFSESNERGRKMVLRGESATQARASEKGEQILSPLADLDTDQVWDLIALMRNNGEYASYTDFNDLLAVYSSAGGSSCPLVAEYRMNGASLGSCDSRTGCHQRTKVQNDTSLENMLQEHPELQPLYALRQWVSSILFDFDRRIWVGRTIDDYGYVTIQPDALAPQVCMDLLRFACTIDADESERAKVLGRERFFDELIPIDVLTLIDFYWSVYGLMKRPYQAWRVWRNVYELGKRYYPPQIERMPRQQLPEPRYLYVGDGWNAYRHLPGVGLRDLLAEALEADTGAEYPLRDLPDGRQIWDFQQSDRAHVDLQSPHFWDAYEFLLWEWVEEAEHGVGHTVAVLRYLQCGMVQYSDHGLIDQMCRRAAYRDRNGIGRSAELASIMPRTISRSEYLLKTGKGAEVRQTLMDLSVPEEI